MDNKRTKKKQQAAKANVVKKVHEAAPRGTEYEVEGVTYKVELVALPAIELDEALVDKATETIRTKIENTLFRGMVEIGNYLFKEFYGSSVESVRSHSPNKNLSLRALSDRCGTPELPVSKSWLWNALNVAIQNNALLEASKADAYNKLTPSHRVALVSLGHERTTEVSRLATKAVKNNWTVKRLSEAVAAEKDKLGMKPKTAPLVLKAVRTSTKQWKNYSNLGIRDRKKLISELTERQKKEAVKSLWALSEEVTNYLEALGEEFE